MRWLAVIGLCPACSVLLVSSDFDFGDRDAAVDANAVDSADGAAACSTDSDCPSGAQTNFACRAGQCELVSCNTGFDDCDGNSTNGCEADLSATATCGSCNTSCDPDELCDATSTMPQCSLDCSEAICGEVCADLQTNAQHCGDCDNTCSAGTECREGECNEIVDVKITNEFACARRHGGELYCWGVEQYGRLAPTGSPGSAEAPTLVQHQGAPLLTRAVAIGTTSVSVVTSAGTLLSWGRNNFGQLGRGTIGTLMESAAPGPVESDDEMFSTEAFVDVAGHTEHFCALSTAGDVWCWGKNTSGQLGVSPMSSSARAQRVSLEADATQVAVGSTHSCALVEGEVWCWGNRMGGQLGGGNDEGSTTVPELARLPTGVHAVELQTSDVNTCARDETDRVFCWGSNGSGQVSISASEDPVVDAPREVEGYEGTLVSWVVGRRTMCIVTTTGRYCWGRNNEGQYGDGTDAALTEGPTLIEDEAPFDTLLSGANTFCGLREDRLSCWGDRRFGQIPYDDLVLETPRRVVDEQDVPATFDRIAVGRFATCGIDAVGAALCWGSSFDSVLGSVGPATSTPRAIDSSATATDISVGLRNACAVLDGQLHCWGRNTNDVLGSPGATTTSPRLVTHAGAEDKVAVGERHACLVVGGAVRCWGDNQYGQLGNETSNDSTIPVPPIGLQSVTTVSAGLLFNCALDQANTAPRVMCWGRNGTGQLGLGLNAGVVRRPSQVSLPFVPAGVDAGQIHACAVGTMGELACWGANGSGQLGDGTATSSRTPVIVSAIPGPVLQVTVGTGHTCALLEDGTVFCWGANEDAQLGNGTREPSAVPQQVNISTAVAIETGATLSFHTCAVLMNGHVSCWGLNRAGVAGQGNDLFELTPTEVVVP